MSRYFKHYWFCKHSVCLMHKVKCSKNFNKFRYFYNRIWKSYIVENCLFREQRIFNAFYCFAIEISHWKGCASRERLVDLNGSSFIEHIHLWRFIRDDHQQSCKFASGRQGRFVRELRRRDALCNAFAQTENRNYWNRRVWREENEVHRDRREERKGEHNT